MMMAFYDFIVFLIVIYGLPADVLKYIDLFKLYIVFVCINVTWQKF